ncbi:hypothetical protein GCM10027594_08550 [Hymenobacter agri]
MLTIRLSSAGVLLAAAALAAHAQTAAPGYTIEGESPLLAGQKIYLLPASMLPAKKNEVLDSVQGWWTPSAASWPETCAAKN